MIDPTHLETLFSAAGATAGVGWLLLLVCPRWKPATQLLAPVLLPGLLALAYGALLLPNIFGAEGGFGSLEDVGLLFGHSELLLAGWIHYLAFDLFIGSWEVRDAQRLGIPHLLVVPCLLATFLAGPLGLALYLVLRAVKGRVRVDAVPA